MYDTKRSISLLNVLLFRYCIYRRVVKEKGGDQSILYIPLTTSKELRTDGLPFRGNTWVFMTHENKWYSLSTHHSYQRSYVVSSTKGAGKKTNKIVIR